MNLPSRRSALRYAYGLWVSKLSHRFPVRKGAQPNRRKLQNRPPLRLRANGFEPIVA